MEFGSFFFSPFSSNLIGLLTSESRTLLSVNFSEWHGVAVVDIVRHSHTRSAHKSNYGAMFFPLCNGCGVVAHTYACNVYARPAPNELITYFTKISCLEKTNEKIEANQNQ